MSDTRLFQIKEDDLAVLEQSIPALADALTLTATSHLTNAMRAHIRRTQRVLSDVRWNYGPPSEVETIPAGGKT